MDITLLLFQLAVLLGSVIIHEVAHGAMALRLGDDTAKLAGRLTLNPIKHLDVVGSFLFPLFLFMSSSLLTGGSRPIALGWAKPVPYDPRRLHRDYRFGPLKVALAGPASNLLVAVIIGIIIRLGFFSLSHEVIAFLGAIVFINILLVIFNLLPIPPLDGSKIISAILPAGAALAFERIGFLGIFLILFLLFSGLLGFIYGLTFWLSNLIIGPGGIEPFIQVFLSS